MTNGTMTRELQVISMITKTVLLIHSEPHVREVLEDCLSYFGGWQVSGQESPFEGLQYAVFAQPDAIIFDLSTAGMDFLTFLEKLRAHPETRTIPVVLIAARMKWLNTELFQRFQVAGIIDDVSDLTRLPKQIATLLNWGEGSQLSGAENYNVPAIETTEP
jgi:CheY-like chemotaxis protein